MDFPVHLLPLKLRAFAREAAAANHVPVSLPGMCALAVTGASLGDGLLVQTINGKVLAGNLMCLGSAGSGTGKSEAFRAALAPLRSCQTAAQEHWKKVIQPAARTDVKILKAEINKLVKELVSAPDSSRAQIRAQIEVKEAELAAANARMLPPMFLASDVTTQALVRLVCRMDGQIFACSPDAKNFVDQVLGRYNGGSSDEEVYLKLFSREGLDRHRVSEDGTDIPQTCGSGLWLTQPDKLNRLVASRTLHEGGLLPRLLMAQWSCTAHHVDADNAGMDADTTARYDKLITTLFHTFRNKSDVRTISADADARSALVAYQNSIVDRWGTDLRDVTGFAARWGEYAWRLALVCHAARHGKGAGATPLAICDATAGIELAKWFSLQQLEILRAGRHQARDERHEKVLALVKARTEITASMVSQHRITPRGLPTAATALLDEMVAAGLLVHEDRTTQRAGHTARFYRLPANTQK